MGITCHTHTSTHINTHTHKEMLFFPLLLHGEEKWMDVTGRGRTQWRGHTCFLLHLLPLLLVCHFFFRSHSDFMTHSVSVGRNNVVPVTVCFSCPPELRHNTQCRISSSVVSSFFHEFWSERKPHDDNNLDEQIHLHKTMCHYPWTGPCCCFSSCICLG